MDYVDWIQFIMGIMFIPYTKNLLESYIAHNIRLDKTIGRPQLCLSSLWRSKNITSNQNDPFSFMDIKINLFSSFFSYITAWLPKRSWFWYWLSFKQCKGCNWKKVLLIVCINKKVHSLLSVFMVVVAAVLDRVIVKKYLSFLETSYSGGGHLSNLKWTKLKKLWPAFCFIQSYILSVMYDMPPRLWKSKILQH